MKKPERRDIALVCLFCLPHSPQRQANSLPCARARLPEYPFELKPVEVRIPGWQAAFPG